ncbi:MAG: hypothetical protein DRO40_07100 [Thermoprotei archaeon]|nr:MAG: hypothetical protein DRO40_07100 [Thermoprotei archaeon]
MNIVKNVLTSFIRKNGLNIVSDGDWDGIVGSAILVKWSKEIGMDKYNINFPYPREIPTLTLSGNIIIELSPSRGYKIKSECILIDHHEFSGIAVLREDSKLTPIVEYRRKARSVAELIYQLLGIKDERLKKLIDIINCIDQGRSKVNEEVWRYHKAYLANIDSREFRMKVFRSIVNERYKELEITIQKAARTYDMVKEYVKEIIKRSIAIDHKVAISWYNVDAKTENIAFREAMLELEDKYDLVIMVGKRKDNTIEKLHFGSYKLNVGKMVDSILNILKSEGIKGGGKETAGGIQFTLLTIRFKDFDRFLIYLGNSL